MKYLLSTCILLCILCFFKIQAQEIVTVHTIVTDFENQAKAGEQIIFEALSNDKTYKAISNKQGNFDIQLPAGDKYQIKLKSIGEAQDYHELDISPLEDGTYYTSIELTIQYEPPRFFTLDNVHFDTGKATLKRESYKELNELLELLRLKKNTVIEVSGHTDNVGEEDDNLRLSEDRAKAIKLFLTRNSIDPKRIQTIGYGEQRPIDSNETKAGRSKNRRTEVRILKE